MRSGVAAGISSGMGSTCFFYCYFPQWEPVKGSEELVGSSTTALLLSEPRVSGGSSMGRSSLPPKETQYGIDTGGVICMRTTSPKSSPCSSLHLYRLLLLRGSRRGSFVYHLGVQTRGSGGRVRRVAYRDNKYVVTDPLDKLLGSL